MLGESEEDVKIDDPLFTDDRRWKWMLTDSSYYFDGQPDSKLIYDDIVKYFFLTEFTVDSNMQGIRGYKYECFVTNGLLLYNQHRH